MQRTFPSLNLDEGDPYAYQEARIASPPPQSDVGRPATRSSTHTDAYRSVVYAATPPPGAHQSSIQQVESSYLPYTASETPQPLASEPDARGVYSYNTAAHELDIGETWDEKERMGAYEDEDPHQQHGVYRYADEKTYHRSKSHPNFHAASEDDSMEGDDFMDDERYERSLDGESGVGLRSPYTDDDRLLRFDGEDDYDFEARRLERSATSRKARRIPLTSGNLVIDYAVPQQLSKWLPLQDRDEFTLARYQAVTCGPEEFQSSNFNLRPTDYGRQTEIMVVVTMFSEDEKLFCRTMHGVMKNIAQLCNREKSSTWGQDSWKKVVVCIVADGRKYINPRVLNCLSVLGIYQEGMAKNTVDNKPVQAHLYEYTTQFSITPDIKTCGLEKGIMPTQVMFCLKEHNKKKINSHRWAMQAFAPLLNPKVIMLIDVGTKPGSNSLYRLWKTFNDHPNTGGACGEICAMKGPAWRDLLISPLTQSQNFEYKMSNILDKPTESIFGYISVLPGAFSAYRWDALQNDRLGHGPLRQYFKGETQMAHDEDLFTSNLYLAEDRILAFELVAKANCRWVLRYVSNAVGETDVPDTIAEFINQRRRWLNGSFFAAVYSLAHTMQFMRTDHSFGRKTALLIETVYSFFNILFAWFALANYYIFFMILTTSLEDPSLSLKGITYVNTIVQYAYLGTVIACFLFAMGNRPQGSKYKYWTAVGVFMLTTAYMIAGAIYCIVRVANQMDDNALFAQIVISLVVTYGVYIVASLMALDPWHLVTSMPAYLLFAPTYVNLLNIFAFSNLHVLSWGTKQEVLGDNDLGTAQKTAEGEVEIVLPSGQADIDEGYEEAARLLRSKTKPPERTRTPEEKRMAHEDYFRNVRTNVLLAWALSNALLASTILTGDYSNTFSEGGNQRTQIYMVVVLAFVAVMNLFRLCGSTVYHVGRMLGKL